MVAATAISDGPQAPEAPHRLWTSRDDHQANIASTLPSRIAGASFTDLEHGVRTVVQSGLLERGSWRGGYRNATPTSRVHLTKAERAEDLIKGISEKAEALLKELRALAQVSHTDAQAVEQRYVALDTASRTVLNLSLSLSTVRRRRKEDHVLELASARESLRQLDGIINLLGSTLPPRAITQPPVIETGMSHH